MEAGEDLFDTARTPRPMYRNSAELCLQLASIASCAIAQVGFLNFAISVAPVAYSVPAYQAGLLISTLLLSGWVLGEYTQLSLVENVMFWVGAAIVVGGMLLNAWGLVRQAATPKEDGALMAEIGGGASKATPLTLDATDEEAARTARKAASAKFG